MVTSSICKFEDFGTDWYRLWAERLHDGGIHRKLWEWCIICEALAERDMLRPGNRALGFAVGREPLSSMFASLGVEVDATDISLGDTASIWEAADNQHASGLEAVYRPEIIDRAAFEKRVRFFPADMNNLSGLPEDTYDFLWSSCALEHLGNLGNGLAFVRNAMRLLKVGGVACHTTEFNVSDLTDTIFEGQNVIYRESDIRQLDGDLRRESCVIEDMDWRRGDTPEDVRFDRQPWGALGFLHIKLQLEKFVCTSALLICRRYL